MYYYAVENQLAVSFLPDLPFTLAEEGAPSLFLTALSPQDRAAWHLTDPRQISGPQDVRFLDPSRLGAVPPLPEAVEKAIGRGEVQAVNTAHPGWRRAVEFCRRGGRKKRVHLLAAGDVGGTLLTALKLLGREEISALGIYDINEKAAARWEAELGQIAWPWDYGALPEAELLAEEDLFHCDVFLFAATKAVPPLGSGVSDVRMAQLAANRPIVELYAKKAREVGFRGLFIVLSDPVDPLCRAAWLASNRDETGRWDGLGLLPEQIQGFGLGVMNARAAYFAKKDDEFSLFLTEGRSFGPHGRGLVIANSVERYQDSLSQALTERVLTANLRVRDLGFKPFVAPAVSSGAMQLLLTLRGEWHCGSVCLGGVWFGVRNRFTPQGLETEAMALPEALFRRLQETEVLLRGNITSELEDRK